MKRFISVLTIALLLVSMSIPASALVNGIFLGSDKNGVNIINDKLRPGEEYLFPVLVAVDGAPPTQLTAEDIDRNRLSVRPAGGQNAIASVTVEEQNGLAYIALTPGRKGTVQELTATIRINYRSGDSGQNLTVVPEIKVAYAPMPEESLAALEPGAFWELDNDTPIVTPKQWDSLAGLNEFRDVTLYGNGWRYTVNTTKLGKRNMLVNHDPVMELVQKLPNHRLHFIGFPGEPDFEARGKLALDVSSLAEDYSHDFFLYRCAYGKLYPLTYEYDRDAGEIIIRPTQLSTYLISDKAIALSDNSLSGSDSSIAPDPPDINNPPTGDSSNNMIAYIVALVSLSGLGIMNCSKRL